MTLAVEKPISKPILRDQPSLLTGQSETERAVVKRPLRSLIFSIAAGISMTIFSSSLAGYTQLYYITNVEIQDSLIIGLVTIVIAALLFLRPNEHSAWGLVIMALGVVDLVFVTGITSTIPLTQLSLSGPASFILALIGGFLGIIFKPGTKKLAS